MPTSAITGNIPSEEELAAAVECMGQAIGYGLHAEWLAWYTAGIRQGMSMEAAAVQACIEWDLL